MARQVRRYAGVANQRFCRSMVALAAKPAHGSRVLCRTRPGRAVLLLVSANAGVAGPSGTTQGGRCRRMYRIRRELESRRGQVWPGGGNFNPSWFLCACQVTIGKTA